MHQAAAARLKLLNLEHPVTVTVGVSVYPDLATNAAELVDQADQALLEGKRAGKNRTVVYGVDDTKRRPDDRSPASAEEIDNIIRWFDCADPVIRKDAATELHKLVWAKDVFHHEPVRGAACRLLKDVDDKARLEALDIVRALVLREKAAVRRYYMTTLLEMAENDVSYEVRARLMAVVGSSCDPEYLDPIYRWIPDLGPVRPTAG